MSGIQRLLNKAGFIVDNSFYFKAGKLNKPLSENQLQAKEIFVVAHKAEYLQRKLHSMAKMPKAWKYIFDFVPARPIAPLPIIASAYRYP